MAVRQQAPLAQAATSGRMAGHLMLAATAAQLRQLKPGLLLPLPMHQVAAEAEVVSPQLPGFPTPGLVARVMLLALRAVKPRAAPLVARAWVVTPGPTRPLPKGQGVAAVEAELTLPMPAERVALVATRVVAAAAAGLRSMPWPRALVASVASGWLSSFPMQSEEQNA